MQERDSKLASINVGNSNGSVSKASMPLPSPKVTRIHKTADKPSEAILIGIEKFLEQNLTVVQKSIESITDDLEGRVRAVALIKRLMGEIVNWLSFEEAVSTAEELFSECQRKSGAKHNLSLSHNLLKLQDEFHDERKSIDTKIKELEYERDVTNLEMSAVISNFKVFNDKFHKRRETDKKEAAGEFVENKKILGLTQE